MTALAFSRRLLATAALLAACGAAAPHLAVAQQQPAPTLVVRNAGHDLINTLQISPSSTDRWGPDLLGALQVMPNSAVRVSFAANTECQQDVRVTFTANTEEIRMRVDVCTAGEVAFGAAPPR